MITTFDRIAPADSQKGAPLAGPLQWPCADLPPPCGALALGLAPMSYLNKALLLELFGYENVRLGKADAVLSAPPAHDAVILARLSEGQSLSWPEFTAWLGQRWAVVDVRAAAAMLECAGFNVRPGVEAGSRSNSLSVIRGNMSAAVYPNAPLLHIIADSYLTRGYPRWSKVHCYAPGVGDDLELSGFERSEELERALKTLGGQVAGETTGSALAALLAVNTSEGGRVSIMDLEAVNRLPEPSGAEAPGLQFFLNGLGLGTAVFGAFCCALPDYDSFIGLLEGLASKYPGLSHLDVIGRSGKGRKIYRFRIGCNKPAPAMLFTCGIRPFDWSNTYGLLRYVAFLLEQAAADTLYARYLLAARQVHWIPACAPDGWESRDKPASGLDYNRNFPEAWALCQSGARAWDAYNRRFVPDEASPEVTRGPAPGTEPETRALMELLARESEPVSILGDFHETAGAESFIQPHEEADGSVRNWPFYKDISESLASVFNARFFSHANAMAFGPGLSDFTSYRMMPRESLRAPVPGMRAGWIHHALSRIPLALVVKNSGVDATHYQTLRRTEYAALAAEQIVASERGCFLRNPFASKHVFHVSSARLPAGVSAHIADARGNPVEHRALPSEQPWRLTLPAGGWAWLDYA